MGAGQSCQSTELARNRICDIAHCTAEMDGRDATSASPTDIWILGLQPGTRYGGRQIDGQVVLKVFMTPDTGVVKGSDEIMYESAVYEHVVAPMGDFDFNPHFVQYYGRALGCSFAALRAVVERAVRDGRYMTPTEASMALARNTWYIGTQTRDRPAITDPVVPPVGGAMAATDEVTGQPTTRPTPYTADGLDHIYHRRAELSYGMIATHFSTGQPFYKWLADHVVDNKIDPDGWAVIVQILSALVALDPFQCAHNDLHLGNVLVEVVPVQQRNYVYEVDGQIRAYAIRSGFSARLFDWDRAYVDKLGTNPILTPAMCARAMNCSAYVPTRDMAKFLTHMVVHVHSTTAAALLDLLFADRRDRDAFVANVVNGPSPAALINANTHVTMSRDDLAHARQPAQILAAAVDLLASQNTDLLVHLDTTVAPHGRVYNFGSQHILATLAGHGQHCGWACRLNTECPLGSNCVGGRCCTGYASPGDLQRLARPYQPDSHWEDSSLGSGSWDPDPGSNL
jgi:hypothetical protein